MGDASWPEERQCEGAMKVGIIGAGAVGSACAIAMMQRGSAREIVLVDRTSARAKAVALDMRYGALRTAQDRLRVATATS